jgi:hypothetical protein
MPAFGLLAALCFLRASRTYEQDLQQVAELQATATASAVPAASMTA